jgi:ketosteroid isomerase-like protein
VSRENVEIVRRVVAAFAAGDQGTISALVSPEIEWDFSNAVTWPEDRVYRGFEGVAEFFARWTAEWEDYRFDVEEVIDAGEKAVVFIRDEGRGKSSGVKLDRQHGEVWTISEGKVARIELFDSKAEALAAVGRSE